MENKSKVKIFVTYKDKHKIIKSDIITPIQTGRAIAEENFEGMLGDDTGDNISVLNPYFCETSAIYWVWKHYEEVGNPEYVGFMHYRRHFLFGNKEYKPNFFGLVKFNTADETYLKEDLTNDENIKKIVSQYDGIIPQQIDVLETTNLKNNYVHYNHFHYKKDFDKAIEILNEKYPQLKKCAAEYKNSKMAYFLNMFIFKKDIFFDYCKYLFDILFELYEIIDICNNNDYQNRSIGFISEILTGIYINKLKTEKYKLKSLPVSFIDKDLPVVNNMPGSNNEKIIPIVVCSSNEYVPYLSVFIQSITDNSDKNYTYEINVLNRNISPENLKLLNKQFKNTNIKLKFIQLEQQILSRFDKFIENVHYTSETYARYFIPQILNEYKKVIYCDLDIILTTDIKHLYRINLGEKSIGACKDWVYNALCRDKCCKKFLKYTKNVLKLDNPEEYFQGGVYLMNLEKMRENKVVYDLLKLTKEKKVIFADQCIFNYYFKKDVAYIPGYWNYQINDRERKMHKLLFSLPVNIIQKLEKTKEHPYIIHYSGPWKPWLYPDEEYASLWWSYARKTPFYEEIIRRMCDNTSVSRQNYVLGTIKDIKHYKLNVLKYWKYKLFRNLVCGETKNRYLRKKYLYKDKICNAKMYIK